MSDAAALHVLTGAVAGAISMLAVGSSWPKPCGNGGNHSPEAVLGPIAATPPGLLLGLLCEFAGRTENQFGGSSHLARCLRYAGNVLHDPLRGPLHAAGDFLRRRARSPD
jgi:hypothetical protein